MLREFSGPPIPIFSSNPFLVRPFLAYLLMSIMMCFCPIDPDIREQGLLPRKSKYQKLKKRDLGSGARDAKREVAETALSQHIQPKCRKGEPQAAHE
jgi:hypothetical protein